MQLRRRYDLIPNLVETVKGYAAHEQETLDAVTTARSAGMHAEGPAQQAEAENMLTGALKSLFAVSEAYPDLKANENFLQLQEELTGTEGRIAYARQYYNDAVQTYNTRIQTFPIVLIANAAELRGARVLRGRRRESRSGVGELLTCRPPPEPKRTRRSIRLAVLFGVSIFVVDRGRVRAPRTVGSSGIVVGLVAPCWAAPGWPSPDRPIWCSARSARPPSSRPIIPGWPASSTA